MTSIIVFAVIFVLGFLVWVLFRNNAEVLDLLLKDRSKGTQPRPDRENWSSKSKPSSVPYSAPPAQSAPPRVSTTQRAPASPAPHRPLEKQQAAAAHNQSKQSTQQTVGGLHRLIENRSKDAESGRAQSRDRSRRSGASSERVGGNPLDILFGEQGVGSYGRRGVGGETSGVSPTREPVAREAKVREPVRQPRVSSPQPAPPAQREPKRQPKKAVSPLPRNKRKRY